MLLRKAARLLAVVATVVGAGGIGLATPAAACACGGVAAPGGQRVTVHDEVALVSWDGSRETIVMRLSLQSTGDNAALIVPTPAPATVTAGTAATFEELRELTAPRVITDYEWFGDVRWDRGSGNDGAMAPGTAAGGNSAPVVLDQVRLGPLEATTLSGGDLTGVREWLSANGYVMRDEVITTLEPYLAEGWSFVAMRLTGSDALRGALDPVRLTFDTDHLVYPMRMSKAATATQYVRLYLLSDGRLTRADPDTAGQSLEVDFAGRITDPADAELRGLSANGNDYLTELSTAIYEPGSITSDFTFTASAAGDYRQVVHRTERVEILGLPAGYVLLVAGASVAVVVAATLMRRPWVPHAQRRQGTARG